MKRAAAVITLTAAVWIAPHAQAPPRDGSAPSPATFVVRGAIVDAQSGNPIRRVQVTAIGEKAPPTSTVSDAEGRFELAGLSPDTYTISFTKAGYLSASYGQTRYGGPRIAVDVPGNGTRGPLRMAMFRGGVIAGRVLDTSGEPTARTPVAALRYEYRYGSRRLVRANAIGASAMTDDRGEFRLYELPPGNYYLVARPPPISYGSPAAAGAELRGQSTTFYPNTTDAASAQPIALGLGTESGAHVITLGSGRLATVRGRVARANGEAAARANVMVSPAETFNWFGMGTGGGGVGPDGTFRLQPLPPGRYRLTVSGGEPASARDEIAEMYLDVSGEDIDDLLLVTGTPAVARGRIVTDEGVPVPFKPRDIRLGSESISEEAGVRFGPTAQIGSDMSFELPRLNGRRVLTFRTSQALPDWTLKEVWLNGEDVTDRGIAFVPNQRVDGIVVVLTRSTAELIGVLTSGEGTPVADAAVIMFPADEALWRSSRWLTLATPNTRGEYRFRQVLPHDHYWLTVIPLELQESGDWRDPQLLRAFRQHAMRVSLAPSERRTQDLQVNPR